MRLLFIRHAESVGNAQGRWQGRAEFKLSAKGHDQSERLHERFQNEGLQPTHVYSSPQIRTAETARIVAGSWSVPIVFRDELKEIDVGIFEGLSWDEIMDRYPDVAEEFEKSRRWDEVEGAEKVEARRARAKQMIESTLRQQTNEDVVLMFTHGGIIQHLLETLLDTGRMWGVPVRNTAVFDFTLDVERWSLVGDVLRNPTLWRINRFNDTSHLT